MLGHRFIRSWWRNSDMFWSEMADYAVFSVFLGAPLAHAPAQPAIGFQCHDTCRKCWRHTVCAF